MMQATRACNHNVTKVTTLRYVFDIKEWITPHLDEIRYHTQPHIFLFKRNSSHQSVMYYKQWSHSDWEPTNNGCILLKVCV